MTAQFAGEDITVSHGIRGSIAFGRGKVHFSNHMLAGKAGLTIIPYIDVNHDGLKDFDEPGIEGLSIRLNKGNIYKDSEPAIINITGLEPHTSYHLEIDDTYLKKSNLWVPVKQSLIETDPNQLKKIHIAVLPFNKLSGKVLLDYQHSGTGQLKANIRISDADKNLVSSIHPDNNGQYSVDGLTPGDYILALDTTELRKTNLVVNPSSFSFTIPDSRQGTVIDIPVIVVKDASSQDEPKPSVAVQPEITEVASDSSEIIERVRKQYWLIAGNFLQKNRAADLARQLIDKYKRDFVVITEDNLYEVILNLGTHQKDGFDLAKLRSDLKIDAYIIEKNFETEPPATEEATEVKTTEEKTSEAKASEAKATEAKASEAKASEVKTTEVKTTEAKSTEAKASEVKATEEIKTGNRAREIFLQAGAFSQEKNALDLANRVLRKFDYKTTVKFYKNLYKVMTGPFPTVEEARAARDILTGIDIDSFVADPE